MALLGQASGGFTESSSALRILHVGIRNTVGVLSDDSFTQTNPPIVTANTSSQVDTTVLGVLSGSVAFTRPDAGSNYIGGPEGSADTVPLGVFINTANGNSYENTPGTSSGKGPYVSAQGCYANNLFESANLASGVALTYATGDTLVASVNGYLTNNNHADSAFALHANGANSGHAIWAAAATNLIMGILKMPADATQDEIVYDQRV
jgi:hypothetical protein